MCLASIYSKPSGRKTGYKLLSHTKCTGMCGTQAVKLHYKRWVKDDNHRKIESGGYSLPLFTYEPGFHILLELSDARKLKEHYPHTRIYRVGFREEVAYGGVHWNFNHKLVILNTDTVVAKEVVLLREVK